MVAMQNTQRLHTVQPQLPSKPSLPRLAPTIFGLTLIALYVVIVLNPGLLSGMKRLAPPGNTWMVPTAASGLAMLGFSAAWWVLVRFTLQVQREPFAWTAPLFVVLCFTGLGALDVQIPLRGISTIHLLITCAPLIIAGGAIARLGNWPSQLVGSMVCITPAVGAAIGISQHEDWIGGTRDVSTLLFLASLLFIGLTVIGLAIVTYNHEQPLARPLSPGFDSGVAELQRQAKHDRAVAEQAYAQVVAIANELRQTQAQLANQWAAPSPSLAPASMADVQRVPRSAADDTAAFVALTKEGISPLTKASIVACIMAVIAAGAYWGLYLPEQAKRHALISKAKSRAAADANAIIEMKRQVEATREASEAALAAEREKMRLAAEEAAAAAQEAMEQKEAEAAQEAQVAAVAAKASAAKARSKRPTKRQAKAKRSTNAKAKGQDSSNDPLAGIEES